MLESYFNTATSPHTKKKVILPTVIAIKRTGYLVITN
jgi:hypothetical protein